jgi:uncharacterized membrane protein YedE/YeeE
MTFFPFEALTTHAREAGLIVAVLIGLAFGFVLERAGFGRATKLAAQFYFRDLTVFKVMFTAIVTAMLGLVAASKIGLVELRPISESIASWTYVWPMLAGGLLLGAGFILSGYCPGTSIVSAASGNVDGMFAVAGVVTGTLVYTQLLRIPGVQQFHESGGKEAWFLYDSIRIAPQFIAIAVALMAVLAFIGSDAIEKRERTWKLVVPVFAVLALITLVPGGTAVSHAAESQASIDAAQLATKFVAEPWRYRIENTTVTDLATNRTWRIAGGAAAWSRELARFGTKSVAIAQTPRPAGTFAKPKKKGGGCSS